MNYQAGVISTLESVAVRWFMQFLIKVVLSALIIAGVSELGRRYSLVAAILASLPLTSILALSWLFWDTREVDPVIELSNSIFWVVLPSLVFFLALPILLKQGLPFVASLLLSCLIMAATYGLYVIGLRQLGVNL